ncbi:MAG: bifunctional (p)ppGpp synthetase/guanosine-3',5'-bis(diphosphate) 3'-pyrophosphohydrolase [Clostridia bacterium]
MIDKFITKVKKQYKNADKILEAYSFAMERHSEQIRASNEPYINHCVAVAELLMELNMDEATICAGLLHDTVEDTKTTYKDIKDKFGKEVEDLVKGVTKIAMFKVQNVHEQQIETLRKMFLTMSKDIRVVIIKLCDRLHNMRTLSFLPYSKQIRIAQETKDIFVPLAERLGMCTIRGEMEDLCFYYLQPDEYKALEDDLSKKYDKRKLLVETITKQLKKMLKEMGIEGEVYGRFKHFSSIYKKLQNKGTEKIYDIIGHRVIVDTIPECYEILGAVHNKWKPVPGRIKDYIASPKVNGYRSLHTTLLTESGQPFELQIRTHEMHKICEYGIAAHWRYKDGGSKAQQLDNKLDSIKQMVEQSKEYKDSENFVNALRSELSTGSIWVFTPLRKIIELKEESTPIDFAYAIHSGLGNNCIGAKVNDKIVPLNKKLETGDIVEILTSASPKGPSRDWLNFVKTTCARNKIRAYFKIEMKDDNIKIGKTMLEQEAKNKGYSLSSLLNNDTFKPLQKTYNFNTLEEMYSVIGSAGLTTNQIIGRLIADKKLIERQLRKDETLKKSKDKSILSSSGVLVYGDSDILVKLSKCCSPIPGDEIVGYSVGKGISIHRVDCPNIKNIDIERKVDVSWATESLNTNYEISLKITGNNATNLVNKITSSLSLQSITLTGLNAKMNSDGLTIVEISIKIKSQTQAREIINKLSQIEGVFEVIRNRN